MPFFNILDAVQRYNGENLTPIASLAASNENTRHSFQKYGVLFQIVPPSKIALINPFKIN